MANTFEIPLINSLRFFRQTDLTGLLTNSTIDLGGFNLNYNSRPFDSDFFDRNLKEWQDKVTYVQKWQKGDTVPIYWRHSSGDIADYTINILDCDGIIHDTIPYTYFTALSVGGVVAAYYEYPMYDLEEGIYYAQIKYDNPGEDVYMISEPFHVKDLHEGTILGQFRNSYNSQNVLWEEFTFSFPLRVTGAITEMTPKTDVETYEDQPKNQTLLSGTPYREWQFVMGGNGALVPEWIADKMTRGMSTDDFKLDGHNYTLPDSGGLEPARIANYPLQSWAATLRDTFNEDSVEMDYFQAFDYVFAKIPQTERLYLQGFTKYSSLSPPVIIGTDTFNKEFTSINALCSFMTNWFRKFHTLDGFVTVNSAGYLIFKKESSNDHNWFNSNNPVLTGLLPYWFMVDIDTAGGTTAGFSNTDYISVIWGDGTQTNYDNTVAITHTYASGGVVNCYVYYDTEVEFSIFSGNSSITRLKGQMGDSLTDFSLENESLRIIHNNLFSQYNSVLYNISFQDNELPESQINNLIVMLENARINNKVIDTGGAILLDLQTPSAPPSEALSFLGVLNTLKQYWTVTTD